MRPTGIMAFFLSGSSMRATRAPHGFGRAIPCATGNRSCTWMALRPAMTPLFATLALALVLAPPGRAEASDGVARTPAVASAPSSAAPDEAIVQGRLLAPCCYLQTLDVHESPMATDLRLEVRTRLWAGESAGAIEDDFVARYGERVRAVPKGQDPRGLMFVFAMGMLVATAIGLGALVRRWLRTPRDAPRVVSETRDALDDRVDEELRTLEG